MEAAAEAEAAVKKYEVESDGGAEEDNEDDVSKAFANVSLNLNINKYNDIFLT